MLSNIVLVISLLFFLVEGAKYKVVSNDKLRRKLSKEDKIKAVTQLKEHIASVTGKGKRRIQEVKHLESFNEYDSSYSSEMWTNVNTYGAANCSGAVSMADATYNSICQVGTFITNIQVEDSDNVTYYSARTLFTSDCASKTAVFYASDDCSDTPAKQGNMQSTGLTTAGVCGISEDNDDDESIDFVSEKVSCTSSAEVFLWGAIQKKEYQQTTTCQGDPFNIAYIMGGCYKTTGGGSIYYAAPFAYAGGPTITTFDTIDCSGSSISIINSGCQDDGEADDYDDDDDDNTVDDAMFTVGMFDDNISSVYAWSGSSMGAVLNYSLSAALVLMSCTLFF